MKIIYGICGIGNGHLHRQLPILTHFAKRGDSIVVFAYGTSFCCLSQYVEKYPNVHIVEVAVPYYAGKDSGLDFEQSAAMEKNQRDFFQLNTFAKAFAEKLLGKPDLVISDYEPVSAQYAYAWNAPLFTIDQQSKFLSESFPQPLEGYFYTDEVMRLRMFFPKADARIACSFFAAEVHKEVEIVPPILRDQVIHMKREPQKGEFLVYLSSQQYEMQPLPEFLKLFAQFPEKRFYLFAPQKISGLPENVRSYVHGDPVFDSLLKRCEGLISTAGHTLLSEAMAIEMPVMALPLPLYEQQINAKIIADHGFGMSSQMLDRDSLTQFWDRIEVFAQNISDDQSILLKGSGLNRILTRLESALDLPSAVLTSV